MTGFAPLFDRLVALRRPTLVTLAEQPDDGPIDAGLLALVANVQAALAAVEEMIETERPGARDKSALMPGVKSMPPCGRMSCLRRATWTATRCGSGS